MTKLFGTDGIRGVVYQNLDNSTAFLLGRSLTEISERAPLVVVGRDTRTSGQSLESSLTYGVLNNGGQIISVGILPTNAVSFYTRSFGADYGVMISASHNSPEYNGLKVFDSFGLKLCEEKEKVIEEKILNTNLIFSHNRLMNVPPFENICVSYVEELLKRIEVDLTNTTVILDCCFGSGATSAVMAFKMANANIIAYNTALKGEFINVMCGATNPNYLKSKAIDGAIGFAFDGDCDRTIVMQDSHILDNNRVLYIIAKYLAEKGMLKTNNVIGTVLTNGGVARALKTQGLNLIRANVGDKNVFKMIADNKANFGGEESGHYLFADHFSCSDGIFTALMVAKIYKEKGDLIAYSSEFEKIPAISMNITLDNAVLEKLKQENFFWDFTVLLREKYNNNRILVRPSGTEPKARIYVEGDNRELNKEIVEFCEGQINNKVLNLR